MHPNAKSFLVAAAVAVAGLTDGNAEGDIAKYARKQAPGLIKEGARVGCTAVGGPAAGEACREKAKDALGLPPPGVPYHSQQGQQQSPPPVNGRTKYSGQQQPVYSPPPVYGQLVNPGQGQQAMPSQTPPPRPGGYGRRCQTSDGAWEYVRMDRIGAECTGASGQGHIVSGY